MRTCLAAAALAVASLLALAVSTNTAAQSLTSISGASGNAVAVNSNAHRVFMADTASSRVYALLADRSFSAADPGPVAGIDVGRLPRWIAVNASANRVYVANDGDGTVTVINSDDLSVLATVTIGGAGPIAVDERANRIYVVRRGKPGSIVAIDGSTYVWSVIDTDSVDPQAIAVDAQLGRLFVSYAGSGDVRAIDTVTPPGATTRSVSIPVAGHPSLLVLNPGTHRLYVMSDDARAMLTVIDGSSLTAQSLSATGHGGTVPTALAVNVGNNSVYAAYASDLVVLDATHNGLTFLRAPNTIAAMALDPAGNRIWALAGTRILFQIDGATLATGSVTLAIDGFAIAMDTVLQKGYVAGNGALQFATGSAASTPTPDMYHGLWWNSPAGSESGWGLDISQQGGKVFATWFTYDEGGHAAWFVMPEGNRTGTTEFSGSLYRVTGPSYTGRFDASQVSATPVGSMVLRFSDRSTGTMIAQVNGTQVTKAITRQVFASTVPTCTPGGSFAWPINRTDLWWSAPAGGESGWGVFLTQQDFTLFVTWFTYDTDGKPVWFVGSNVTLSGNQTYSGSLYRTWGPGYNVSPWDSNQVTVMPVGTVTLSFADESNGVFSYNLGGLTGSKAITRQVFSTPATVCN